MVGGLAWHGRSSLKIIIGRNMETGNSPGELSQEKSCRQNRTTIIIIIKLIRNVIQFVQYLLAQQLLIGVNGPRMAFDFSSRSDPNLLLFFLGRIKLITFD